MTTPLSPADLLLSLRDGLLGPWVEERGGFLSLSGDPGELIEALADAPRSFRVILAWAGDDDQTGQELAGIVTNTFEVWLIKSKGLKLKAGEHLVSGETPFLSLLSDLRAAVRAYEFPDEVTNVHPLYMGAKQFEPELAVLLPTTGYKMTFQLIGAVPFIARASDSL